LKPISYQTAFLRLAAFVRIKLKLNEALRFLFERLISK